MSKYTGKTCIVCGEKFKDGDDIVVCPECGTPYHRECYNKYGKCINTKLHEEHKSWSEDNREKQTDDAESITCSACGTVNPKSNLFCEKCGQPLHIKSNNQTFNQNSGNNGMPGFTDINDYIKNLNQQQFSDDAQIEDIKVKDYNKYIGNNSFYYLMQFTNFSKRKSKISFNFTALFFPELYFCSRKMYLYALPAVIFRIFNLLPYILAFTASGTDVSQLSLSSVSLWGLSGSSLQTLFTVINFLMLGIQFLSSIFGNYLYFNKCKKDIKHINNLDYTQQEKEEKLVSKGGLSIPSICIAPALYVIFGVIYFLFFK